MNMKLILNEIHFVLTFQILVQPALPTSHMLVFFFRVENLAFEKPVWEQYPWSDKNIDYGSENAVDGLYSDRGASGGQCTISDGMKSTATLRVDLGEVASISYINIYYRTDNQLSMLIVVCTYLEKQFVVQW